MERCRHEWVDRTDVLRTVFPQTAERQGHVFFACTRCARVLEVLSADEILVPDEHLPEAA